MTRHLSRPPASPNSLTIPLPERATSAGGNLVGRPGSLERGSGPGRPDVVTAPPRPGELEAAAGASSPRSARGAWSWWIWPARAVAGIYAAAGAATIAYSTHDTEGAILVVGAVGIFRSVAWLARTR